jgi:hypothetical protein
VVMGAISVGLSLGIAVILVRWFNLGIIGLCLGIIVGRSILSVGYPILVGRLLGVSFSSQLKSIFRPAFVTLLFFSLATFFDSFILAKGYFAVGGWISLGLYVSMTLIGALVLAFYLGLSVRQRETIFQRIRVVLAGAKTG